SDPQPSSVRQVERPPSVQTGLVAAFAPLGFARAAAGGFPSSRTGCRRGGTSAGTANGHRNGATFGVARSCNDVSAAIPEAGTRTSAAKTAGVGILPVAPATGV